MSNENQVQPTRSLAAAALVGIGLIAAVDQIIFHQLLRWHHFFDHATPAIGILSDGLLHAAELIALIAGFFMLMDLQRFGRLVKSYAWAGLFIGMGGFQLFDGVLNHKILRIHQIRYDVELWPYDLAWNGFAAVLLCVGLVLWRRAEIARQRGRTQSTES